MILILLETMARLETESFLIAAKSNLDKAITDHNEEMAIFNNCMTIV